MSVKNEKMSVLYSTHGRSHSQKTSLVSKCRLKEELSYTITRFDQPLIPVPHAVIL